MKKAVNELIKSEQQIDFKMEEKSDDTIFEMIVDSKNDERRPGMFKNNEERLEFIQNKDNWKQVYESQKFNIRISVLKIRQLTYVRTEILVSGKNWHRNGEDYWMDAGTRKQFESGCQSGHTFSDNQIAEDFKANRDQLK